MSGTIRYTSEVGLLEPYGHMAEFSKIERYWKNSSGPVGLFRKREKRFDPRSGMTYVPMRYVVKNFEIDYEGPADEWICQEFIRFVKTEFSERGNDNFPDSWPPKIDEEIRISESFLTEFLDKSSSIDKIKIKQPVGDSYVAMAGSIYEILCNSSIGSSKNRSNNDKDIFIENIIETLESHGRLLFVLPGFPFKDQNIFRVPFDASSPDMGEFSFMVRLHMLTQALYQIHPFGADIVVLTDGELYGNIFGVSTVEVSKYAKRILTFRNKLNLQGTVSFISLKDLLDRMGKDGEAWSVVDHIKKSIKRNLACGNEQMSKLFDVLVSGMKWNCNSRSILAGLESQRCWDILRLNKDDIDCRDRELWEEVHGMAVTAAVEYSAINLAIKFLDLIRAFFPQAIRGTVHPKAGQFALAGSNLSFAWNGVAWSKKWPSDIDSIEVRPYFSLGENSSIRKVVFEDSDLPAFYTGGYIDKNIQSARLALSGKGWQVGELFGREFKDEDLTSFVDLGKADRFYSWEREEQDDLYFQKLFCFRKEHYLKYGFGINGVWWDGRLIGQCGLQVLNEKNDEVELTLFLGKEFTNRGFGSILTKYVISRCRKVGVLKLFVVVQSSNSEGVFLVNKFGGKPVREIHHFGRDAVAYTIDINRGL